jgi:hypothetical protein
MHHRMEEMTPLLGMRLGHPQEVAVPLLDGMLCAGGQNTQPLISHRRYRRGVIRTITPARAGVSITSMLLPRGQKRLVERRPEGREFWLGETAHGP